MAVERREKRKRKTYTAITAPSNSKLLLDGQSRIFTIRELDLRVDRRQEGKDHKKKRCKVDHRDCI